MLGHVSFPVWHVRFEVSFLECWTQSDYIHHPGRDLSNLRRQLCKSCLCLDQPCQLDSFTVEVRASCHGMSAASGKVGAFIGTAVFPLLQRSYGNSV